jgi:hypothetical protein
MRRLRLAALGLAAVLSACSGSTASKTTIPSTTVPTTLAPTTVPVITTVVVPTTTPATTTMPPTTAAPTTTLAPTTTTVPLAATFQALIDRYDAVVAAILADPRVAADSSNPKVVAFLALFPPNSSFTATTLKFWEDEGAQGRFYRAGPGGAISKSTVKNVTAISTTEASFDVCVVKSTTIVDAAGNLLESSGGRAAGTIVAVNVDGNWLIRDLTRTSPEACPKPGATG